MSRRLNLSAPAGLLALVLALPATAQEFTTPRPSPGAKVVQTVGTTDLSVSYSRPGVKNRVVWGGLVLFGLSAVVWLFALSRASLSFAYPFAALSYVLILVFSVLVLHETVQPLRWLGVAFIVTGIVLVAQTPHT